MLPKFKVGDRVHVIDAASIDGGRRAWIGKELVLRERDDWDEPAWCVVETECYYRFRQSELEAVQTSPVLTVTRKEIVSGKFGHVTVQSLKGVSDVQVGIGICGNNTAQVAMSGPELTAAIATLITIRDALAEVTE